MSQDLNVIERLKGGGLSRYGEDAYAYIQRGKREEYHPDLDLYELVLRHLCDFKPDSSEDEYWGTDLEADRQALSTSYDPIMEAEHIFFSEMPVCAVSKWQLLCSVGGWMRSSVLQHESLGPPLLSDLLRVSLNVGFHLSATFCVLVVLMCVSLKGMLVFPCRLCPFQGSQSWNTTCPRESNGSIFIYREIFL